MFIYFHFLNTIALKGMPIGNVINKNFENSYKT